MCGSDHAISFLASNRQSVLGHFELRRTVMQCQKDRTWTKSTVQPSWYGFASPVAALIEFLDTKTEIFKSKEFRGNTALEVPLLNIPIRICYIFKQYAFLSFRFLSFLNNTSDIIQNFRRIANCK